MDFYQYTATVEIPFNNLLHASTLYLILYTSQYSAIKKNTTAFGIASKQGMGLAMMMTKSLMQKPVSGHTGHLVSDGK